MDFDVAGAFDALMGVELWIEALVVLAGYLMPFIAKNVLGGVVPDVADQRELYGLVVLVLGSFVPDGGDDYDYDVQLGAGVFTAESVLLRFNLRSTITGAGAGA